MLGLVTSAWGASEPCSGSTAANSPSWAPKKLWPPGSAEVTSGATGLPLRVLVTDAIMQSPGAAWVGHDQL
jgi:hypothetical protein